MLYIVLSHVYFVRMDKKGGDNDVIYPDIMFCVDGFEEVQCTCTYTSIDVSIHVRVYMCTICITVQQKVILAYTTCDQIRVHCM